MSVGGIIDFKSSLQTFEEFKVLVDQLSSNTTTTTTTTVDKLNSLLNKLKLTVATFGYPNSSNTANSSSSITIEEQKKRLFLCREILEYAILLSVKTKDTNSFERFFAQIKTFYFDYGQKYNLPDSSRQMMFLGLNLLRLLAKNRLAEFHTELELIPLDLHHQNVFIKHPVQLEQSMMEGAYHKVIKARLDVPSDTYVFFMDILMETVRDEIAGCSEKAFYSLSIPEAKKLLGFTDDSQLKKYADSRKWSVVTENGTQHFSFKKVDDDLAKKTEIPASQLIKRSLFYAKELERIV